MTWRSFDARSPSLVFGTELPARVEESAVNARKPPASPRSSKNLLDEQRSAIDRPRPPKVDIGGHRQAIPPTLQQSLAARLDRLGKAREVAQIGAVLGRDFTYSLLRATAW